MTAQWQVAMLVASTRKGSINERLARAIERQAPTNLAFRRISMVEMPFYNFDLEPNRPDSVKSFVNEIRQADAVCIVTPEYNRSIPAVLKNAIDWGSKPADASVWRNRVIATTGASPGAIGTAIGQQHLRQILGSIGAVVLPGLSYISFKTPDMIDANGIVADEGAKDFIADFVLRFDKLIECIKTMESRSIREAAKVQKR